MHVLKSKKGAITIELIVCLYAVMAVVITYFVFRDSIHQAIWSMSPSTVYVQHEETGRVVEKNIVPGYRCSRNYLIAVETKDEGIVELEGEEMYYKVSVGDEVELEKTVLKNKNTKAILNEEYELKG